MKLGKNFVLAVDNATFIVTAIFNVRETYGESNFGVIFADNLLLRNFFKTEMKIKKENLWKDFVVA
jgi:hypothetical protein